MDEFKEHRKFETVRWMAQNSDGTLASVRWEAKNYSEEPCHQVFPADVITSSYTLSFWSIILATIPVEGLSVLTWGQEDQKTPCKATLSVRPGIICHDACSSPTVIVQ
jgi:hypothetical protein